MGPDAVGQFHHPQFPSDDGRGRLAPDHREINMKDYVAWLKQNYGLDIQYATP